MTFEQDYNKLIQFAANFIWSKKINAEPADLVNDAFIKHIDSGKGYLISDIKKLIISVGFYEVKHESLKVSEFFKDKRTNNFCKECKEDMPINAFYVYGVNVFYICKRCYIKKYYESNKQERLLKSAIWKEKNKEKIKIQRHEYYCRKIKKNVPIRKKAEKPPPKPQKTPEQVKERYNNYMREYMREYMRNKRKNKKG